MARVSVARVVVDTSAYEIAMQSCVGRDSLWHHSEPSHMITWLRSGTRRRETEHGSGLHEDGREVPLMCDDVAPTGNLSSTDRFQVMAAAPQPLTAALC